MRPGLVRQVELVCASFNATILTVVTVTAPFARRDLPYRPRRTVCRGLCLKSANLSGR